MTAEEAVNITADFDEDMNPHTHLEVLVNPFDLVIA